MTDGIWTAHKKRRKQSEAKKKIEFERDCSGKFKPISVKKLTDIGKVEQQESIRTDQKIAESFGTNRQYIHEARKIKAAMAAAKAMSWYSDQAKERQRQSGGDKKSEEYKKSVVTPVSQPIIDKDEKQKSTGKGALGALELKDCLCT